MVAVVEARLQPLPAPVLVGSGHVVLVGPVRGPVDRRREHFADGAGVQRGALARPAGRGREADEAGLQKRQDGQLPGPDLTEPAQQRVEAQRAGKRRRRPQGVEQ